MRALLFALLLAACASTPAPGPATGAVQEGNGVWLVGCTDDPSACTRRADAVCHGDFRLIESGPLVSSSGARIGYGIRVRCT